VLARIVPAAVNEAGLFIPQHDEPAVARRRAGEAFEAMLAGVRRS